MLLATILPSNPSVSGPTREEISYSFQSFICMEYTRQIFSKYRFLYFQINCLRYFWLILFAIRYFSLPGVETFGARSPLEKDEDASNSSYRSMILYIHKHLPLLNFFFEWIL